MEAARRIFQDLDDRARQRLFFGVLDELRETCPEGRAAAPDALAEAEQTRGDMAQALLDLADYLPLLLVIAAGKLKISLRKGDFAAEVELSLTADLPRLKEAIQGRLERARDGEDRR